MLMGSVFIKVIVAALAAGLVPLILLATDFLGLPIDTAQAEQWALAIATAIGTFLAGFLTPEKVSTLRSYIAAKRPAPQ
jgi:hypothetical protein